jgi:hypothetical protein
MQGTLTRQSQLDLVMQQHATASNPADPAGSHQRSSHTLAITGLGHVFERELLTAPHRVTDPPSRSLPPRQLR